MKPNDIKELRLISIEKLLEMQINNVPLTLVDALPHESYEEGHLPGAVNIPADVIAQKADSKLDKNKTVVTYCANYACEASTDAARQLMERGYADVLDFKGGKRVWQEAGFELEK